MKTLVSLLLLVSSANAIVTRWAPCCFHLDASGAVTGTVGQLDDGQARVNGPLSPSQFCIADGAITDANGRGCILTRELYTIRLISHPPTNNPKHRLLNSNATLEPLRRPASASAVMGRSHTMGARRSGNAKQEIKYTIRNASNTPG
jgi:hypothetical protein